MRTADAGSPPRGAVAAILVAAGRGTRAGSGPPKQFRSVGGTPLLALTLLPFAACQEIGRAILVVPDRQEAARRLASFLPANFPVSFVEGGETRQASMAAGLSAAGEADLILVHDGVRPFVTQELIERVIRETRVRGAAVPLLPVRETLKRVEEGGEILETMNRNRFALAQTPQGFRREVLEEALRRALSEGYVGTDEADLVERLGHPVAPVPGIPENLKITTPGDFARAEAILRREAESGVFGSPRIGLGYDVHPLTPGRPMVLGGVTIPHPVGPSGHSDGDLVCHAAIDAILGAAGLPDIGQSFPDTEERYRGASSLDLLSRVGEQTRRSGFILGNLDVVVVAEQPRLAPHLEAMRRNLARALDCDPSCIGIKGKRGEGLGLAGRGEGIVAHAVALLIRAPQASRS